MRRHLQRFVRGSFRPEVVSDVVSGANLGQVALDVSVKFCDSSSNWHFRPFLNFDNYQLEAVSDVISGMTVQNGSTDVCANFGESSLKPTQASFSALFRTPITSDRKYVVTSYSVCCRPDGCEDSCKIW